MGKVFLENVQVYAYHGCLPEETLIGSDYRVDLWVEADLQPSAASDALKDTVDYVTLCACIREEMATPAKLLEHVGQRILDRIFAASPLVTEAWVKVAKINPPIGGHVTAVAIELKEGRPIKK
jgi:dihydroneopterin aldolase